MNRFKHANRITGMDAVQHAHEQAAALRSPSPVCAPPEEPGLAATIRRAGKWFGAKQTHVHVQCLPAYASRMADLSSELGMLARKERISKFDVAIFAIECGDRGSMREAGAGYRCWFQEHRIDACPNRRPYVTCTYVIRDELSISSRELECQSHELKIKLDGIHERLCQIEW